MPYGLNERGKKQSRDLGTELLKFADERSLQIHPVFYSSVLLRAYESARICQQQMGIDLQISQHMELNERSVGSLSNLEISQIEEVVANDPRYPDLPDGWKSQSNYRLPYPGAESLMQAGIRVAHFVEKTIREIAMQDGAGKVVLFFSHGAAIRHCALHWGILSNEDIPRLSMHHCSPVFFKTLNGEKFIKTAGEWKIREKKERND